MPYCSSCGKELRSGLKFCTGCGAKVISDDEETFEAGSANENREPHANNNEHTEHSYRANANDSSFKEDTRPLAPTIVLAPPVVRDKKSTAKLVLKCVATCVLVVAIIMGGVWSAAWIMSQPFRSSSISEVDNQKYVRMMALVEDVRNPNFEDVIDDLLKKSGNAENYSFLQEYTEKFDEILGTEYTDKEKLFCDCCYFVWYTEYQAKRYEWLSKNSGLLNGLYTGKANSYRTYADTLYGMLRDADSETDMKNIKSYCEDHEIIADKKTK